MFLQRKTRKSLPQLSTASLPDIIFILLFFFLVATKLRKHQPMVQVHPATEHNLERLDKKSLVSYIYIGNPTDEYAQSQGNTTKIQLNDVFADISDIPAFIAGERDKIDEEMHPAMVVSLRVDANVPMGVVNAVKAELQKANVLRINYSAREPQKTGHRMR